MQINFRVPTLSLTVWKCKQEATEKKIEQKKSEIENVIVKGWGGAKQ